MYNARLSCTCDHAHKVALTQTRECNLVRSCSSCFIADCMLVCELLNLKHFLLVLNIN